MIPAKSYAAFERSSMAPTWGSPTPATTRTAR